MEVVVGLVARPHGVAGELAVEVRTDEPERRFAPGCTLGVAPGGSARPRVTSTATVRASRRHQGRLLLRLEGVGDRDAAEALRGAALVCDVDETDRPADPEEFYDHQLVGLTALTTAGEALGRVAEVQHGGAQDLLVVEREDGSPVLVPFVQALVPVVDLDVGEVRIEPRPGLLEDLDED